MRSNVTIITAADDNALTTLDRVKSELSIADHKSDALLEIKINEASSLVEAELGFRVPRETVSEVFWHEANDSFVERLILRRFPVTSITDITADDETIDSSLYRLDANTGQLFALSSSGFPWVWRFYKSLIVNYTAGYVLPSEDDSDLPPAIESATVDLVSIYWQSRGRDATLKAEEKDIPGVLRTSRQYWVGNIGEPGELPPSVVTKLSPFRRVAA